MQDIKIDKVAIKFWPLTGSRGIWIYGVDANGNRYVAKPVTLEWQQVDEAEFMVHPVVELPYDTIIDTPCSDAKQERNKLVESEMLLKKMRFVSEVLDALNKLIDDGVKHER